MAMVYPDVAVRGLEKADEYEVKPQGEGSPTAIYLLGIAEKKLTQADIRRINELLGENPDEKKKEEALKYMMNADAWVREQFEAMKNPGTSIATMATRLRAIRDKANELGVEVEASTRRELETTLAFYDMAEQRSKTMVTKVAELTAAEPGSVIAMVIGAGHSEQVTKLLREQGLSYALVRPIAFNPEYANLSLEQFERKTNGKWARTSPGTLGQLLNGQRKPPPVIGTSSSDGYASAIFAAQVLAEAVRDGKRIPDDVRAQLAVLPGASMDWNSVKVVDDVDVLFSMRLQSVSGNEVCVWMRGNCNEEGRPEHDREETAPEHLRLGRRRQSAAAGPTTWNQSNRGRRGARGWQTGRSRHFADRQTVACGLCRNTGQSDGDRSHQ